MRERLGVSIKLNQPYGLETAICNVTDVKLSSTCLKYWRKSTLQFIVVGKSFETFF